MNKSYCESKLFLDNLVFYKGTLITFYNTPYFFEKVAVGLILWNNGTKTELKQISTPYEGKEDILENHKIGEIHKGLVFMAWGNDSKSYTFLFYNELFSKHQ